jgi:hypothetical protein
MLLGYCGIEYQEDKERDGSNADDVREFELRGHSGFHRIPSEGSQ